MGIVCMLCIETSFCCQGRIGGAPDTAKPYVVYTKNATYDSCCFGEIPYDSATKECALQSSTFSVAVV